MRAPFYSKQGFTLIEILIVCFIIGLLAVVLLANTRQGNNETNLHFAAQNFANVLKQARSMAANGKTAFDVASGTNKIPAAYGVFISTNAVYYLFADQDGDGINDSAETLETITLPEKITMDQLSGTILFQTPGGETLVNGSGSGSLVVTFTNSSIGKSSAVSVYAGTGKIESSF